MAKTPSKRERYARFAKLAKNPGTRASIKTADLKGFAGADELRAERAKNTRLDAPFVPGGQLSNRDVARERNAASKLQYGDEERELEQARTDSDYHRDTRLPAWFADYQRQLQAGQAQQEAANAQAAAQITQLGAGDANVAGQLSPVASQQAHMGQFGLSGDTAANTTREQDAGRVRQMLNSSFGGMLTTQGAGRVGQMIDQRTRIVPGWQIQEQAQEQGRGMKVAGDQAALAKLKGEFATRYMADARERESKGVLERAAFGLDQAKAEAGLAMDQQEAKSKRYDTIQDRKLARQREDRMAKTEKERLANERERIRISKEKAAKGTGKDGKKLGRPLQEPASSLSARRRIETIRRDLAQRGFKTREEAKAALRKQAPHLFSPDQEVLLSAALDRQFLPGGKISKGNTRALRNLGVFITTDGAYWSGGNRGA